MRFELLCPDGLPASTWAAINYNRGRLVTAAAADDRPAIIGAAKELTESVARSVLAATEQQIGDGEDFPAIIKATVRALDRVPGQGTSASEPIKGIVGGAQKFVLKISELRNDVGTGHGRAHLPDITDEMAEVAADAAILWSRWALRRLGNVLKNYPGRLLEALAGGATRARLQTVFDDVRLPEQEPEIQHAIGVAFGREAAGGFGNAVDVGVVPAVAEQSLDTYSISYRTGLVDGMVINREGKVGLPEHFAAQLAEVLRPVPAKPAAQALHELAARAAAATWMSRWRGDPVDPAATVAVLRATQQQLDPDVRAALATLADALDPELRRTSPAALRAGRRCNPGTASCCLCLRSSAPVSRTPARRPGRRSAAAARRPPVSPIHPSAWPEPGGPAARSAAARAGSPDSS